jgi:hypothetical protein
MEARNAQGIPMISLSVFLKRLKQQRHLSRTAKKNIRRYGPNAPIPCERIWIDPMICDRTLNVRMGCKFTSQVMGGDWDLDTCHVEDHEMVKFCIQHWQDGIPWEDTGVYERMLCHIREIGATSHGSSLEDMKRRYEKLDKIFAQVREVRQLLCRAELLGDNCTHEQGGVYVHIDRAARPIFGGSGCHRIAMARVLELPIIPAMIGVVHADALATWRNAFYVGATRPKVSLRRSA